MDEIIVGAQRIETIRALADLWDSVLDGYGTKIAMVYGGKGYGKTAVLRALYRHCAMRQGINGYWPQELPPQNPEPLLGSSNIHPVDGVGEQSENRSYIWWGIEARMDRCAVEACGTRLEPLPKVATSENEEGFPVGRLIRLGAEAGLLMAPLIPIVAALPAVTTIGVAAGVAGLASDGAGILRDNRARRARATQRAHVFRVDESKKSRKEIETTAEVIAWMGDNLPLAIVVDDAEKIDETSVQLLRHVAEQNSHQCLIVFAADDRAESDSGGYRHLEEWLDKLESEGADQSLDPKERVFHEFDLEELAPDALNEISIHELGPGSYDLEALRRLVEEAQGSPGRLLELLRLPVVRQALQGRESLPSNLSSLGSGIALLEQRFDALSVESKQSLSIVALQGLATDSEWAIDGLCEGMQFSKGEAQSRIEICVEDGWLVGGDGTLEFATEEAYRVVIKGLPNTLTAGLRADQMRLLLTMVEASRSDGRWTELPPHVCAAVLASLCDAADELEIDVFEQGRWEAERLRMTVASGHALPEEYLEDLEQRLSSGIPSLPLVAATAEALYEAGHLERARLVMENELQRVIDKNGPDHKTVITPLHNYTVFLAAQCTNARNREERARLYKKASGCYRRLLKLMEQHLKSTDKRIPDTRYAYAEFLRRVFKFRSAAEQCTRVVREMRACPSYGADHRKTLTTRGNLALWTGHAGDAEGARKLFEGLLPDQMRVLGENHPDTLTTRHNLAEMTGHAGDAEGARDMLEGLLPDRVRVLGEDHPGTLATRGNLAEMTGLAGDAEGARDMLEGLLPDQMRVLGKDHPDTLTTRGNLALWTGRAGDAEGARKLLEGLLPDQVRVLGKDHPDTLTTRHNLAEMTGHAGDAEGARDMLEGLLPDRVRVLGKDHPDTLTTRHNLAEMTGRAGDAEGARDMLEGLLPDRVRVLGEDHPGTLATRHNLAEMTGLAGDAEGARKLFEGLLPDQVRVLGEDHPDTLTTRHNLAVMTGRAGNAEGARKLLEGLLPDRVRVLGKDHPDTLTTRHNLAEMTGRAGNAEGARKLLEGLLPDQMRVLGEDHPDTLTTRHRLTYWTKRTSGEGKEIHE